MRPTPLLALVLLCPIAARADPVTGLAELTRQTLTSPDPAATFYGGLAGLGDLKLDRDQIAQALKLAKVPLDSDWAPVLTSIVSLEQEGDQVRILRDQEVVLSRDGGTLRLDTEVSFTVSLGSDGVLLEDMQGVSVGMTKYAPYPVRRSRYTVEDGVPVAYLTVGQGFFMHTMRIESAQQGLSGAVGPK